MVQGRGDPLNWASVSISYTPMTTMSKGDWESILVKTKICASIKAHQNRWAHGQAQMEMSSLADKLLCKEIVSSLFSHL